MSGFLALRTVISSAIMPHISTFEARQSSGLYDDVFAKLVDMGKTCLAESEYDKDFVRVKDWGKNFAYHNLDGAEFRTNIVGQVCAETFGTILSAKGNHFTG